MPKGYHRGRARETASWIRPSDDRRRCAVGIPFKRGEIVMKIIVSLFVALSVISAATAAANAFDAKSFYAQLDRQSN